jgi:type II secretory pathway component PulJ
MVMLDRAMELRHLAQAERHISEAERRVLVMEKAIARAVVLKMNTDQVRLSLALIVDGLVQHPVNNFHNSEG